MFSAVSTDHNLSACFSLLLPPVHDYAMTTVITQSIAEDFIAFDFGDDNVSSDDEPTASTSVHALGQPQLFTKGKKRTAEEMEAENGYSKKQRLAAESRVTPWADNVDWDNCRNAAEMCVLSFSNLCSNTFAEGRSVG